ncbi:dolichol kinase [Chloropicon primus]|uniref:dolichol kinase n=1 Tax=Chloropicon primus TaxID=1764295 RepID=A0A5B8MUB0_9CHLO|nr:hypothetical protein A3770_12p66210 [Chloropicon primus]UPR03312.1 dolichol kinase [Chloropicon primus]|mmetsp:Transcript_8967/g.25565  ORF Transcript_8967/g.25565 Transcript_8967/m.25565 type:complete len:601 (-) Transcript_8967:59-1861(-)|eukprot:QDZ24103.1 hypothetical protein A3770_12p66210 [Chloropicon primus]
MRECLPFLRSSGGESVVLALGTLYATYCLYSFYNGAASVAVVGEPSEVHVSAVTSLTLSLGCAAALAGAIDAEEGSPQGHLLGTFTLATLAGASRANAERDGSRLMPELLGTFVSLSVAASNWKHARALGASAGIQAACLISVAQALGHLHHLQETYTWFTTICIPLAYFCSELGLLAKGRFQVASGDALLISNGCVCVVLWCLMDWHSRWFVPPGGDVWDHPSPRSSGTPPRFWTLVTWVLAPLGGILPFELGWHFPWFFEDQEPPSAAAPCAGGVKVLVQGQLLFASVMFIALVMRLSGSHHQDLRSVVTAAAICFLIALQYVVGMLGLVEAFRTADLLLLGVESNVRLLLFWFCVVCIAIPAIALVATGGYVANIVVRKLFHVAALAVFASAVHTHAQSGGAEGAGQAVPLLRFCSASVLCALVLCEFVRIQCKESSISERMTSFFGRFTDSRDSGTLILSHLSLLLGLSVPFWFNIRAASSDDRAQTEEADLLLLSSGILALGIADVLGVLVGKNFGRLAICRGSKKTLEGTCAAILGTVAFALTWDRMVGGQLIGSTPTFVALCVGMCLLEAFTPHLDNLYIPLFFFTMVLLSKL